MNDIPTTPRLRPRLLMDVTQVRKKDAKTGIPRVVRETLRAWLQNPPAGYEVHPVYFGREQNKPRFACAWASEVIGRTIDPALDGAIVLPRAGDVFVGVDLNMETPLHRAWFKHARAQGAKVMFVGYDFNQLNPNFVSPSVTKEFAAWWEFIARHADGIVWISKASMDEAVEKLKLEPVANPSSLRLGWSHIGANPLGDSALSAGKPAPPAIEGLSWNHPVFLMVGTVAPYKGHRQTLAAFELLWAQGSAAQLVIVGKAGWMMDGWMAQVEGHPLRDKKWFWPYGISDDALRGLYQNASALIAPSEGEGFGLPLIEAAQYGLPIIARDMPVFREVAGAHAFYFQGKDPAALAEALRHWQILADKDAAPPSSNMPFLSWAQSAEKLLDVVLERNGAESWAIALPPNAHGKSENKLCDIPYSIGRLMRHPAQTLALWLRKPRRMLSFAWRQPGSFWLEREVKMTAP